VGERKAKPLDTWVRARTTDSAKRQYEVAAYRDGKSLSHWLRDLADAASRGTVVFNDEGAGSNSTETIRGLRVAYHGAIELLTQVKASARTLNGSAHPLISDLITIESLIHKIGARFE
jgi:hypothetical protein